MEELTQLRDQTVSLFGASERWRDDTLAFHLAEFERYELRDATSAVRMIYRDGMQGVPSPSTVLAKIPAAISARIGRERRSPTASPFDNCRHIWGVMDTATEKWERERLAKTGHEPAEGLRLVICALCHDEKWSKMLTRGEFEDRQTQDERGVA